MRHASWLSTATLLGCNLGDAPQTIESKQPNKLGATMISVEHTGLRLSRSTPTTRTSARLLQ